MDTIGNTGNRLDEIPEEGIRSATLIRDLNLDERPREKAIVHGIDSLSDVELLALLLGSGLPGKSVLDLSREILADVDNRLARLSRMPIPDLKKKYRGVGDAKATLLVAAMAFGRRVHKDFTVPFQQMRTSRDVYEYMREYIDGLNYEGFWVLHLNRANRVVARECLSRGGIAGTAVDIKLLAKSAVDHLDSGIILIHNHPSGNLCPSAQDDSLTRRIVAICEVVDVKVQDHVIVASNGFYSYRDEGRL